MRIDLRNLFRSSPPSTGVKGLGTFLGIYTPTVLTILGVIMYLRFGWVVGQVGLSKTLLIVVLANSLTLVTTLSLSGIATNTRVGVGGAYYMISRSLGLEIGGAIGLPLYLSQALSVTLYAFGLAESLRFVWADVPVPAAAFLIIVAVAALALRGAGFALRSQVPIMVLIAFSLLALFGGALLRGDAAGLWAARPPAEMGFWGVFAVFFPAVTGIMAGLSLSGDLADPRKSIPRGTLLATLTGFAIYLLVPVLLALGADTAALRENPLVWTQVALLGPWLILPGLWGAIFSSAVGSMLGAPRTLQALARDGLAPAHLGRSAPGGGEPRSGLLLTLAIALGMVFLGDLNTVAEVVTMFFLTVYGTTSLVAALEKLSGNPSWRPRVQPPWWLSLAGGVGCFGVMVLINLPATVIALAVELGIWLLLRRKVRESRGDVRRDIYEAIIRWALVRLSQHPMTARNWRPHVLVFVRTIERRLDLVRFGEWFSENRGVVTVCELREGDLLDVNIDTVARQREMEQVLRREGIGAFAEVNVVQHLERGMVAVAQANGMAGMESNTVLVGMPDELERLTTFVRIIPRLAKLHMSTLIGRIRELPESREGDTRRIDIWWGGLQRNGDLMLLLAYLLTHNPEWRSSRIRVLSIASNDLMRRKTEAFLEKLIPEIRIEAEIDILARTEGVSIQEMIRRESADADLVFMGLSTPEPGKEEEYARRLQQMVKGLPSCFLVHNGSLFIGELLSAGEEARRRS